MTATIVPTSSEIDRPKRAFATHTPKWQRFQAKLIVPSGKAANAVATEATEIYPYQRQYSSVYYQRLVALKPRCYKAMEGDSCTIVERVLGLRENVPSMIVGTLVKEADKPDEDPIHSDTECRPSDQLYLEDDSGRVALKLDNVQQYCTGVVMGVKGVVDDTGTLQVEKMFPPAPPAPASLSGGITPSSPASHKPHLLIVSSLLCGDSEVSSLPREMLASYLQGHFTSDAAKVSRVLVAGNGPSSQNALHGIMELDAFAAQLSRGGIPLDIMPGKNDPTTANWPQRPLHSSLIPNATSSVFRTPNPYAAGHGKQLIVGADGTNIIDLQKHILNERNERLTEMEALEKSLEWSHMCPTGPSSVPTVPHTEQDPMVLDQMPQVYFCGNASKFAHKVMADGTVLLCVPKFSETSEAVLLNLDTLKVELLRFENEHKES
jgi:DNA polymerase delta subunit 2